MLSQQSFNNNQVLDDLDNIDEKFVLKKFRIDINFEFRKELIYYFDEDNILRLCISWSTKKKIFKTIHDDNHHSRYHRCLARIIETLYISSFLKKIRIYVKHCLIYQINQTKRHRLYNELMSISFESHSFYIIAMNYVIELFDKYDCLFTIIDKFSKRLQLILEYIIDFVIVWARRVLSRLQIAN